MWREKDSEVHEGQEEGWGGGRGVGRMAAGGGGVCRGGGGAERDLVAHDADELLVDVEALLHAGSKRFRIRVRIRNSGVKRK